MSQFRGDLIEQVRALLRAESTERKLWRKHTWLGRRAVFARLEQLILRRHWGQIRGDDVARHLFVDAAIDSLEQIEALDLISAGRWAETAHEDPIAATSPVELWGGQKAPLTTEELARRTDPRLNRRRG